MNGKHKSDNGDKYSIRADGLNLWYGEFQALHGVNVRIRSGIVTSLVGPSGCGKTTLLRCFNRINERFGYVRTEGVIRVLEKNIYDSDVSLSELRRHVGMVFQRPNPLPVSIYDNVLFGTDIHAGRRAANRAARDEMVESALREVQLWDDVKDRLRRRAVGLSLEQQQKLCIARLLPLKPKIILMDEPCSALDAGGTEKIENLLGMLCGKHGMTVVIVTHNMGQARRASDECIFMLNGRMIEHDTTLNIFHTPKHPETDRYVSGRYG